MLQWMGFLNDVQVLIVTRMCVRFRGSNTERGFIDQFTVRQISHVLEIIISTK
jgi:hypothetical protein